MNTISLFVFQNEELLGILIKCLLAVTGLVLLFRKTKRSKRKESVSKKSHLSFVKPSKTIPPFDHQDYLILLIACVCYAIISFTRLGSTTFPTTTWQPQPQEDNQSVIFELPEYAHFDSIYVLYGEGDNNSNPDRYQLGVEDMVLEGSNDLQIWEPVTTLEKGSIYEYQIIEGNWDYRYIRLTAASKNQTLTEIGFKQFHTDTFLPIAVYQDSYADSNYPASLMIDEQDKLVIRPTFYDEGYFDEVYHPRNAWEIANGQRMYATVHPLFGTNLMAFFIRLFGMSPFVWRLPGALFGIAILPVFYHILHLLFSNKKCKILGIALCAADFMHLTTSRIGTLEPFSVFFILLMFDWMMKYFLTSFYDTKLPTTWKYLFLSGLFMGIGIATKWTACYSAVGLAVILFSNFAQRYIECRKAKQFLLQCDGTREEMDEAQHIVSFFPKAITQTILLCFLFFILLPAVIYWLSYLPDHVWKNDTWSIANVWSQNMYMYHYHTNLVATHPYQSSWYQWLLDIRPIWYYSGVVSQGTSYSISCFSNPLLTWVGLPAILYTLYACFRRKDAIAWLIVIGYLSALLPWVSFVQRCVFAYHFYPTSFFTMLAIVYLFSKLMQRNAKWQTVMVVYLVAYVFLFVLFLPVTAGFGTSRTFIQFLEWFPTWYFG